VIDVDGAYDLHVHSSPDLFPRIADDAQMVADAERRGFAGVVMKNHCEGTASRAALAAVLLARVLPRGSAAAGVRATLRSGRSREKMSVVRRARRKLLA
jgi:Family of unknown function (DUF6282)